MSLHFCKFFTSPQGCRFGNKCRYKHSDPFSDLTFSKTSVERADQNDGTVSSTPSFKAAQVPAQYTNKSSAQKENGSIAASAEGFKSELLEQSKDSDDNGSAVSSVASGIVNLQVQGSQKLPDSHEEEYSRVLKDEQQSSRRCHYFSRFGTCRYGDRCQFAHTQGQWRLPPPRFHHTKRSSWSGDRKSDHSDAFDQKTDHRRWMKNPINNGQNKDQETGRNVTKEPRSLSNLSGESAGSREQDQIERHPDQNQEDGEEETRHFRKDFFVERKSVKLCPFFPSGRCWRGSRCKFLHQADQGFVSTKDKVDNDQPESLTLEDQFPFPNEQGEQKVLRNTRIPAKSAKPDVEPQKPRVPYIPQGVRRWQRSSLDDTEASRLRRMEIDQLAKRFPKNKLKVERDSQESFECVLTFTPTDPDWPFDVKNYDLRVCIPNEYPLEMLIITLPAEQDLPETVRRYVEASITEWFEEKKKTLEDKGQVELVFRPFLRWLDRSIEDVVTNGLRQLKRELTAKAAGFQFISAKELQKQYQAKSEDEETSDDQSTDEATSESDSQEDEDDESNSDSDDDDQYSEEEELSSKAQQRREDGTGNRKARQERMQAMLTEPIRKGTEVGLKNLQLKESIATVHFDKIFLTVQCERCKGTSEFLTSGGRTNLVQCMRCAEKQLVTFRPAFVHPFSSAIGYLDLEGCLPFDVVLQNCSIVANCLHCSKETKLGGLQPGQLQNGWCRVCHQKMKIGTDGVRFTQLEPSATQDLKNMLKVVVHRQKRLPKDPAIQEGKPLPAFGTCKHYKKSYRWLRFPCCGKAYPCDLCHDNNEDHEMKLANRMICGFCCKEQVYSADRPCKGCDLNLTKVHTQHWEGGQGCRDKITMSKNDKQKHRGMSKTASKHSQKVQDMQSKKKTKLRHT